MDSAETLDAVREETATERDRLGSDKLLIAVTGATLEPAAVSEAVATRERSVARALEQWATDETDELASEAFASAAEAAAERANQIDAPADDPDALGAHLATVEETAPRVGAGLVAVPMIADRLYLQVVNFFVNEADEKQAAMFRELRTEASDLSLAQDVLESFDEDARLVARDSAVETIDVAYDDYADTLDAMGLDPRPIC